MKAPMSRRHRPPSRVVNINLPLNLPGGRTLLLAPVACPKCATVQRPIDVDIEVPRLTCRGCGVTIFEITPRCA
jgi:hypothetical protein